MKKIEIQLTGVAAELVLGNYMPKDATIFENWEEFYHYNDIIHQSQLLADHISEIRIKHNDELIFTGLIPATQFIEQKSSAPVLVNRSLYLRTECAEQASYKIEFEVDNFDLMKLKFETQDYDFLFKIGSSFLSKVLYDGKDLDLEWVTGKPIGSICILCRFENGYLHPLFDAVNKLSK